MTIWRVTAEGEALGAVCPVWLWSPSVMMFLPEPAPVAVVVRPVNVDSPRGMLSVTLFTTCSEQRANMGWPTDSSPKSK